MWHVSSPVRPDIGASDDDGENVAKLENSWQAVDTSGCIVGLASGQYLEKTQ